MSIEHENKIFTFVIAALKPAWHDPCLWYPQYTENYEKVEKILFTLNFSYSFDKVNIREMLWNYP